jgi:hypothetical protein
MATHFSSLLTPVPQDLQERRIAVDSALGSTLAEGVSPSPEVLALSERYAAGEIGIEEFGSAIRAIYGL